MMGKSEGSEHGASGETARWLQRLLVYQPATAAHLQGLLASVIAHIPRLVVSRLLASPDESVMGLSLAGTVMFADVDGFTPLAERLAQMPSDEGVEVLTDLINRFLDILIHTTQTYGGDLLKFGGDAGLLLFQGEQHACRAVAAALVVQRTMKERMAEVMTALGRFPFQVNIGCSSGPLVGLGLGDRELREFMITGLPLDAMGKAEAAAPPGGVVIHASTHRETGDACSVTPVAEDCFLVSGIASGTVLAEPSGAAPALPPLQDADQLLWYLSRLDVLTPYLAPGLLDFLTAGATPSGQALNRDLRLVTVMMVSLQAFDDVMAAWGRPDELVRAAQMPNAAFIRIRDTIHRYDGTVNKIAVGPKGAYVMVLFGAPNSHEDDPLRAVLAALELQELFDRRFRIGINTGFVFAGDVGTVERREYTVMGDAVNLAARLMVGCEPGAIWLGPQTARHTAVARQVAGEWGPPTRFKGKQQDIAPYSVHGLRANHHQAVASPTLVGRDAECRQMEDALRRSRGGDVCLMCVYGTAGVGKTHLVQVMAERAVAVGFAVHMGTAPSYGDPRPFVGWREVLTSLLGLDTVPPENRVPVLMSVLARCDVAPWAALIAPLVGLSAEPSTEVLSLPPDMLEMQRQTAVLAVLAQMAQDCPRLLIFDNAQWMSEASLDLLDVLIDAPVTNLIVFVVCRESSPVARRWRARRGTLDLALAPLTSEAMRRLVREAFPEPALPESVVHWVVARSGGLPIFAGEAIRALMDAGLLQRHGDRWVLTGSLDDFGLPDMVYALIQSRIDQLSPPNRHLLRAAAAIGQEMTLPMLVAAYGEEREALVRARLPHLAPFGLLPRDLDGQILIFRQPLVREVAYHGLPHRVRRAIHRRLVTYLDLNREASTPNWLALVAFHAFEGALWARAVEANVQVGRDAVRAYLAELARLTLSRALQAADQGELDAPEARFEAHDLLSETLTSLGDYEEALLHLHAARRLALKLGAPDQPAGVARTASLDYREATVLEALGRYQDALDVINHGLSLPGVEASLEVARLYLVGADLHRRLRDYDQARAWAARAVAMSAASPAPEAHQVRSRATYMVALLASLARRQGTG